MRLKDSSVNVEGMTLTTQYALGLCDLVFKDLGVEMIVTSGMDSPNSHSSTSLHKKGRAFDIRLPSRSVYESYFGEWDQRIRAFDGTVCEALKESLGEDFQVVLELHQKSPWSWHVHVELDPK